jgi:hypothetical protein
MTTRLATTADIDQILALQAKNLYANLSEAERIANGFVTTSFTVETIQTLITQIGGYCGTPFAARQPFLSYLMPCDRECLIVLLSV